MKGIDLAPSEVLRDDRYWFNHENAVYYATRRARDGGRRYRVEAVELRRWHCHVWGVFPA